MLIINVQANLVSKDTMETLFPTQKLQNSNSSTYSNKCLIVETYCKWLLFEYINLEQQVETESASGRPVE